MFGFNYTWLNPIRTIAPAHSPKHTFFKCEQL
jgi:hypothetical protein